MAFQSASADAAMDAMACPNQRIPIKGKHRKIQTLQDESHFVEVSVWFPRKNKSRERKHRYLLDASGIELAILDAVGELVEGLGLLLQVLVLGVGLRHHLHSFVPSLHFLSATMPSLLTNQKTYPPQN